MIPKGINEIPLELPGEIPVVCEEDLCLLGEWVCPTCGEVHTGFANVFCLTCPIAEAMGEKSEEMGLLD